MWSHRRLTLTIVLAIVLGAIFLYIYILAPTNQLQQVLPSNDIPNNVNLKLILKGFEVPNTNVEHYGFPSQFQGQPPTDQIVCKMANQADMLTDWANQGIINIHMLPNIWHRKQWELAYIQYVVETLGMLQPGKSGLVFAVGSEPLVSYFASVGIKIYATDSPVGTWAVGNQWSSSVDNLMMPWYTGSPEEFHNLVQFEAVDMNHIPERLLQQQFDFIWTTCSVEHIGSIDLGKQFIINSMKALKPGGVAIHTVEFNLQSLDQTIESGDTSIWRKSDIESLAFTIKSAGYFVYPMHFGLGTGHCDFHLDKEPYTEVVLDTNQCHLKLKVMDYRATTFAMVFQVPLV